MDLEIFFDTFEMRAVHTEYEGNSHHRIAKNIKRNRKNRYKVKSWSSIPEAPADQKTAKTNENNDA